MDYENLEKNVVKKCSHRDKKIAKPKMTVTGRNVFKLRPASLKILKLKRK